MLSFLEHMCVCIVAHDKKIVKISHHHMILSVAQRNWKKKELSLRLTLFIRAQIRSSLGDLTLISLTRAGHMATARCKGCWEGELLECFPQLWLGGTLLVEKEVGENDYWVFPTYTTLRTYSTLSKELVSLINGSLGWWTRRCLHC